MVPAVARVMTTAKAEAMITGHRLTARKAMDSVKVDKEDEDKVAEVKAREVVVKVVERAALAWAVATKMVQRVSNEVPLERDRMFRA